MKKTLLIGWKDITLAFRDRAALVLMLLAPFLLTIGLGFVTGRFAGTSNTGLSDIPVVVVNQDEGQLGEALVSVFQSEDLTELITLTLLEDEALARQQVDEDKTAAAIIIPAGFTDSVIPAEGQLPDEEVVQIEFYANPARPNSAGIVQAMLESFVNRLEAAHIGAEVVVSQLLAYDLIAPEMAAEIGLQFGQQQAAQMVSSPVITLNKHSQGEGTPDFDILAYMAPGMALLFLMYTVSNGGRTLLAERTQGTLPRLLVSPTRPAQVLSGKVIGIYLTGVAQMFILILASALLFQLRWGDYLGVLVLVLAAVFGATGWGMLITAMARTPNQIASIGSAVMLTFGILGGSFVSLEVMPGWVQWISRITPNAWGIDGFATLANGGNLINLWQPITALLVMGAVLLSIAIFIFNRRGMASA